MRNNYLKSTSNHLFSNSEVGSVSFLLGAGFSAPQGYPLGKDLNSKLLNFDNFNIGFSPSGILMTTSKDDLYPNNGNGHQRNFEFCKMIIKMYAELCSDNFNYEAFYDFISCEEESEEKIFLCWQKYCDKEPIEYEKFKIKLLNIQYIYNQMVYYLIKDKNGDSYYDNVTNNFKPYNSFLSTIHKLSLKKIINVHTLNHDLLFEAFNRTPYIDGRISDGFDKTNSDYYGKIWNTTDKGFCQLEKYTSEYGDLPIRLYKLHGSIDYIPFHRQNKNAKFIIQDYVKIKSKMEIEKIYKNNGIGYDTCANAYHPDFLTGIRFKQRRYKEHGLFDTLFRKFEENLLNADKLFIIGYGCGDDGINDRIKKYFDYQTKQIIIFDKFASKGGIVESFASETNAIIQRISVEEIKEDMILRNP